MIFHTKYKAIPIAAILLLCCGLVQTTAGEKTQSPYSFSFSQRDRALIVSLLFYSCPTAVTRLVVTVIVDAVKRVKRARSISSWWPSSHVDNEILKALRIVPTPALTNFNSAASIIFVGMTFLPIAAIQHRLPNVVFRPHVIAHMAISAMPEIVAKGNCFRPQATAALSMASDKRFSPHTFDLSALAARQVRCASSRFALRSVQQFHNCEATECLAG